MGLRAWLPAGILVAATAAAGGGSGPAIGPPFTVSSFTTGLQRDARVVSDAAGNFIVVWVDAARDGDLEGVFGRRFDSDGAPLADDFQIPERASGAQSHPDVALDGSGYLTVVWTDYKLPEAVKDIWARRFGPDGEPVGPSFRVNTFTPFGQQDAAVAVAGDGSSIITWWGSFGQDGAYEGIFAQRYGPDGETLGEEFQVNTFTPWRQALPDVAVDESGNFVVVWQSLYQDGSGYGVFGRRFDAEGQPVGPEFRVNSHTPDHQSRPSVAADGKGGFVVVWGSKWQDGSSRSIFAQRYDAAGSPVGGEFQVNSYSTGIQGGSEVVSSPAGGLVVTWTRTFNRLVARRFDADATPRGPEFVVNQPAIVGGPSIAMDGDGRFIIAWEQGYDYEDIMARRYKGPGIFTDGFESGDTSGWSTTIP